MAEGVDIVHSGDTWSGVTRHLLRILPCLYFGFKSVHRLTAGEGSDQRRMLGVAHVLG